MDLPKSREATVGGMLAREMARMEEEKASWRKAMAQTDIIGKQVRELAEAGSTYSQMAKELRALQSPAMSIAQKYKDLSPRSAVGDAFKAWKESERAQFEHMRKMLDPIADIRKSLLVDNTTQQLIKELTEGNSTRNLMKEFAAQASGTRAMAKLLAQQAEESRGQTKRLFENFGVGSSV